MTNYKNVGSCCLLIMMVIAFISSSYSQVESNKSEDIKKQETTFTFLYKQLEDLRKGFDENAMKTAAFILLAIGWVLTSDKGRDFLSANRTFNSFSLIVVCLIAIVHSAECLRFQGGSMVKIMQMNELHYMDPTYYHEYLIDMESLGTVLATNLSLMSVLFMMVYFLRKKKPVEKV